MGSGWILGAPSWLQERDVEAVDEAIGNVLPPDDLPEIEVAEESEPWQPGPAIQWLFSTGLIGKIAWAFCVLLYVLFVITAIWTSILIVGEFTALFFGYEGLFNWLGI